MTAPFGAAWLTGATPFPARVDGVGDGEAFGEETVVLSITGDLFRLSGLSASQADTVRRRFGPLLSSTDHGFPTRLRRAEPGEFTPVDLVGRELTFDVEASGDTVRLAGPFFRGLFDDHGGFLWCLPRDVYFIGWLENYLRVVCAYRLLSRGELLVHGAAAIVGGEALLFPGRSGAGKSTLSRLLQEEGYVVLSDELNAVVSRDGRAHVLQMPFAGDLGQTAAVGEPVPLGGVFALRKGEPPGVSSLGQAAAVGLLLACTPFVNGDPARGDRLLACASRLAGTVPLHVLTFALASKALGRLMMGGDDAGT